MSDDFFDGLSAKDLVAAMRGESGEPIECSFCNKLTPYDQIHPEEAGDWACTECLERWDREEERC